MHERLVIPRWKLSSFYFFYFVSVGTFVPYWSLYLKNLGFDAAEIGELIAFTMLTKLFAPYMWGWIADHSGRRMQIVRIASIFCLITFAGVYISQAYAWLAVVMFCFSFFWNANLPQFEAVTLEALGSNRHHYTRIRLWGSLGFVLAVILLGLVLEQFGSAILPHVIIVVLFTIAIASFTVPNVSVSTAAHQPVSIVGVLKNPTVVAIFVVCFLIQASHGPYYTFYTVYLEAHEYSRPVIGQLWALGVFAEIIVFLVVHQWLNRYRPKTLLLVVLALAAIRWLLIGLYVENYVVVTFAQLLHAASFGLYHAVAIQLMYQFFPNRLQGRGQALYSSLSFGAGGAVGSLSSGYLWESLGPTFTFTLSASLCVIGLFITLKYIHLTDSVNSYVEKAS